MNTTKHTEGPWCVVNKDDGRAFTKQWREIGPGVVVSSSYDICRCGERETVPGVMIQESDARLIASAPQLLEALKELLATVYDVERNDATIRAVRLANDAINTAEGSCT